MTTKTSHTIAITWPKRIYLYGEDMNVSYENQTGSPAWSEHNLLHHKNIEYVRADLVKEQLSTLKGDPLFKANNFIDQNVITPEEMQSLHKYGTYKEPL